MPENEDKKMTVRIRDIKDCMEVIPGYFSGENIPIGIFLDGVREAFQMLEPDKDVETTFVRLLRSRLKGEALKSVYGVTFNTLKEFENHFKTLYTTGETLFELEATLARICQKEDESIVGYYTRLQEIVRKIPLAYKAEHNTEQPKTHEQETEKRALKCFLNGLKIDVTRRITKKSTLKEALRTLFWHLVKILKKLL